MLDTLAKERAGEREKDREREKKNKQKRARNKEKDGVASRDYARSRIYCLATHQIKLAAVLEGFFRRSMTGEIQKRISEQRHVPYLWE